MRKRQNNDSMGLMIDTMCNGVGGLVLVAILIVLISMSESPSSVEGQMRRQQLKNEIQALEIRADRLRAENARMSKSGRDSEDSLVETVSKEEIDKQLTQISRKTIEIQTIESRLEEIRLGQERARFADPGQFVAAEMEVLNKLRDELKHLEHVYNEEQASLSRLEGRYNELLSEVSKVKDQKSQTLKTPVERDFSRYDFIYVRFGKIYTLLEEDLMSPPSRQFSLLHQDEFSISFEPKLSSGVGMDSGQLVEFLTFVRREGGACQLGFYPDSFELFLPLKEMAEEYGVSLGINFYTDELPPGYTTQGGSKIMGQGQ